MLQGESAEQRNSLEGEQDSLAVLCVQRDRVGSKMADKSRSESVRVVLEERKAAEGKCLVGCQGVAGG